MMNGDDDLLFFDEDQEASAPVEETEEAPWKILLVDDEEEVHRSTKLVLDDFSFDGKKLDFISAYSGEEALGLMRRHSDIAVILLDVVMETPDAGLDMARRVRQELVNHHVRIILRTGQPGQAPEQEVITGYDINDYKEKSELTSQKLVTAMVTALRCYRDIMTLERHRVGLQQIIEASADLFGIRSIRQLAMGVLNQLSSALGMSGDALFLQAVDLEEGSETVFRIVAGTGRFENCTEDDEQRSVCLDSSVTDLVGEALTSGESLILDNVYLGVFPANGKDLNFIYLEGTGIGMDRQNEGLVRLFSKNVSVAVDNVRLNRELIETKREVVQRLGEALERREERTGHHSRRVSEMAGLLCRFSGGSEEEVERIMLAASMHDVGNVGVPDSILNKRGPLTPEEYEIARMHTVIGRDLLLSGTARALLGDAAIVAHQHHECWDGSGYPQGLSGASIHPWARIVSICDVFDTLLHRRPYAEPWSMDDTIHFIVDKQGQMFDPDFVQIFVDHLLEFRLIQEAYPD